MSSSATVRSLLTCLLLLAALAVPQLRAELVAGLETVELPLPDRSSAALNAARREGLAVVVLRLTGQAAALESAAVTRALANAQRYTLRYSYRDDGGRLGVQLDYDGAALRVLLREAGLPLWTANRPAVLTWLVVSDGDQRQFATTETLPEAIAALQADFRRRAVPLRLPLYDLSDRAALPLGLAWRQDSAALVGASARYGEVAVLAGRVARLSDGRWLGDWRFLQDGAWQQQSVSAPGLEAFTAAGADLAARSLSARYAVTADSEGDLRLRVAVSGVRSFEDFRRVRALLEALEPVESVLPERVEAGRLLLRLESAAQEDQLARIIELDARFLRRPPAPGESGLHYEWRE
jgi:hypothetical protein